MEWYKPVAMPIVLEVCPATTGCVTRIRLRCVYNETFGSPNCNEQSCPHCPLHSFCLEKAQTSTLDGRASILMHENFQTDNFRWFEGSTLNICDYLRCSLSRERSRLHGHHLREGRVHKCEEDHFQKNTVGNVSRGELV